MKTCHLVLTYENYDRIDKGTKTIEYRRNCEYHRKRFEGVKAVTFHRGYTKTTMTFEITFLRMLPGPIEIHLGRRLK